MRSAPTLKIWMTPLSSVAMLEKLALLRIAFCNAPVLSIAFWRRTSVLPSARPVSSTGVPLYRVSGMASLFGELATIRRGTALRRSAAHPCGLRRRARPTPPGRERGRMTDCAAAVCTLAHTRRVMSCPAAPLHSAPSRSVTGGYGQAAGGSATAVCGRSTTGPSTTLPSNARSSTFRPPSASATLRLANWLSPEISSVTVP